MSVNMVTAIAHTSQISPRSSLQRLHESVPKTRKRRRITDDEFCILKPGEQESLCDCNYRVQQLKDMCRHYGQKVGGNKDQLTKRLYNYLRLSQHAIRIQRAYRRTAIERFRHAKGPAAIKRSICVNDSDFLTMEKVSDIPYGQFFSFEESGTVYGFDILSLFNLFSKKSRPCLNPYTRAEIPATVLASLRYVIHMSRSLGLQVEVELEEEEMDEEKQLEMRGVALFQAIGESTQYIVDHMWWWRLGRISLIRFIREVHDIWSYRAQLTDDVKRQICPPHGNPFQHLGLNTLQVSDVDTLRTTSLRIMERMITTSHDEGSRGLGANYVLCALSLVNENVAEQFPWLYQSVAQI